MTAVDIVSQASDDAVLRLKASAISDVYDANEFIPWQQIESRLIGLGPAIETLQGIADINPLTVSSLSSALQMNPNVLELFHMLLSAPATVGFADGRQLPLRIDGSTDATSVAELLIDLGIENLVHRSSSIADLVKLALVSSDSRRRRIRRDYRFTKLVESTLLDAVKSLQAKPSLNIAHESRLDIADSPRFRFDFVVSVGERPVAAIATVFQSLTGGRQQRDLILTYPSLQDQLDQLSVWLVLILDGPGLRSTPDHALRTVIDSVGACMTLRQAQDGALANAIASAVELRGARSAKNEPLGQLITAKLRDSGEVHYEELDRDSVRAEYALADYLSQHADLGLELRDRGRVLAWKRPALVTRARVLTQHFKGRDALQYLADLLGATYDVVPAEQSGSAASVFRVTSDPILPDAFLVAATTDELSTAVIRAVARDALRITPNAGVAFIVTQKGTQRDSFSGVSLAQSALPTNVITLTASDLVTIAEAADQPRDSLVSLILSRADLSKVSPFVVRSVTPARIFVGREPEEASMLSTLTANSVALIGGRRIGKTSLMRRAEAALREAGYSPHFIDCQTVQTWSDFAEMVQHVYGITLRETFRPTDLLRLVEMLDPSSDHPLVLLDEVDHLLSWDQRQVHDGLAEPFFRTCRTISQSGRAQFVFAGERVLARAQWNPESPLWNFCRSIPLKQLTQESTEQLLVDPLKALQINITPEKPFIELAWHATNGHPQIVQTIGDRLVQILNLRSASLRKHLSLEDLQSIVTSFEFNEHYLETYWGQSTPLERIISLVALSSSLTVTSVYHCLQARHIRASESEILVALRMLDLYGILDRGHDDYTLRAGWFAQAISAFGGPEGAVQRYAGELT